MAIDLLKTLSAYIRSNTEINNLVSGQIYTDMLPQSKAGRAIVMWVIAEEVWQTLDGQMATDQATVQIDAYGDSRAEANEVAWLLKEYLDPFQGMMMEEVMIREMLRFSGIAHGVDRAEAGSQTYRFIASQDFLVTYDSN